MRRVSDIEQQVLRMIFSVGGSYCPDSYSSLLPSRSKLLHGLVKKGRLTVEETDAGPRFSLTDWWDN